MVFDVSDNDGVQALEIRQLSNIFTNSIFSGCAVSPGTNAMTVQCTSGFGIVDSEFVRPLTQDNVALAAADGTNPRRDLVYVDTTGTLQVLTGTPAPKDPASATRFEAFDPSPPDSSSLGTTGTVLAEVWVPAGASDIVADDVRDMRLNTNPHHGIHLQSGIVTLSGGYGSVTTGVTSTTAAFSISLGVQDPGADCEVTGRMLWDDSLGEHVLEILEDTTTVGNPTVNYAIKQSKR